jgi:hypothetical protein
MAFSPEEHEEHAVKSQVLFREVNERLKELNSAHGVVAAQGEWICECANESCAWPIDMPLDEYEEIRSDEARFFVAPSDGHVWPDFEKVTRRTDRYWTIEKTGRGREIAARTDPRSDHERAAVARDLSSDRTASIVWLADDRWEHRYLVFTADGSSSGEECYPVPIEQGDFIVTSDGRRHRVVDVVAVEGEPRLAGSLMVQPA